MGRILRRLQPLKRGNSSCFLPAFFSVERPALSLSQFPLGWTAWCFHAVWGVQRGDKQIHISSRPLELSQAWNNLTWYFISRTSGSSADRADKDRLLKNLQLKLFFFCLSIRAEWLLRKCVWSHIFIPTLTSCGAQTHMRSNLACRPRISTSSLLRAGKTMRGAACRCLFHFDTLRSALASSSTVLTNLSHSSRGLYFDVVFLFVFLGG